MSTVGEQVVKKTLSLNPKKLERLRQLFQASSDSEAVRRAIKETLAYKEALKAARRIQKIGRCT